MLKLLICLLSLCAAVQGAIPASETPQSNQFLDSEKGYKITLPSGWQVQRDFMGLDVFAAAPPKNDEQGSRANISVISTKVPENLTLEVYYTENLKNLEKALKDFKQIETGNIALEGATGKKVAYSHSVNDLKLRVVQYFILKNHHAFIITCASDDNDYNQFASTFEQSVRSFKTL